MRALHVYRTYLPDTQGGLEETIRQICLNTIPDNVSSRVFCPSRRPDPRTIDRTEAQVHRVKLSFEVASCGVSWEALRAFPDHADWADIIHYHFPWPYADVLHLLNRPQKPAILTYHSDIVRQRLLNQAYSPVMHRFLGSVDKIVCTSPNYLETSEVLRRYQDKVEIIPIGINEESYPSPDAAEAYAAQRRFGHFFLFVGVLRYYKGLHILLEAAQGAPYNIVIAGAGPIESELKAKARALGLDNVFFPGRINDTYKVALFQASTGVVFPSFLRSEAFGVTLLEGSMFGKPLISAEVGSGTSHVNEHGHTGHVVQAGSPRALRQAMDHIHQNPNAAAQMGQNARLRYERLFTGQQMGRSYADLYRRLSGSDTAAGDLR